MGNKPTQKQKKLVQGIVGGLGNKEAYLKAGYSPNMSDNSIYTEANKTLNKPIVKEYHEKLLSEVEKKSEDESIATALEAREFITSVMRGEIKEEYLTDDGAFLVAPKIKDRLKASELLGKTYGIFTDKKEVNIGPSGSKLNSILKQLDMSVEDDADD